MPGVREEDTMTAYVDRNGEVAVPDLLTMLAAWGTCKWAGTLGLNPKKAPP